MSTSELPYLTDLLQSESVVYRYTSHIYCIMVYSILLTYIEPNLLTSIELRTRLGLY